MDRNELILGVALATLFVIVGVVLFATGGALYLYRVALVRDGVRTDGTISGFERVGPGPENQLSDTILVPVVTFTSETGETISFQGSMSEPIWSDYQSGATVSVVYDPDNPAAARIDTCAELWFAPILLSIVGAGLALGPPLTIWSHVRSQRHA